MKNVIAGIIAFILCSGISYADNRPVEKMRTPEQVAQLMIEKLEKDIVLSDNQKMLLLNSATEFIKKQQEINAQLKADAKLSPEQKELKSAARAAYEADLNNLLTPEQQTELASRQEQRNEVIQQIVHQEFEVKSK